MKSYAIEKDNKYIASGEKAYISLVRDIAEIGGGFVTVLKTDIKKRTDGVSLFYMPYDRSFDVTYLQEMGREGSSWAAYSFKDISIPKDYMLGKLNPRVQDNTRGL
ncbi:acyl-CoA dehydrogenase domain-containing protein [mine drainage metagenome]|uniref:Acyl-CoA dehydrogenase domain-containing protein n=1 Tax=mine drainage metagenome TaxID=410659 RepID=T1AZB5_9ZZZZ